MSHRRGCHERERAQQMILAEVLTGGDELTLVLVALRVGSRRQAGSTCRNVYLTKWRVGITRQ